MLELLQAAAGGMQTVCADTFDRYLITLLIGVLVGVPINLRRPNGQ